MKMEEGKDMDGKKFDTGKTRYDLICWLHVKGIADVLQFGANKYGENNWKQLENATNRYFAAAIRHLVAWEQGEQTDAESGLSHLSHAACNLMFLGFFEENSNED